MSFLGSTAFGAAVVFGFRHGFDWDHLAALTDLTGSQSSSRRSMWVATLYALGHALMVVLLGTLAILFAEQVPDAVDVAMERVVGLTLLALGLWMVWTAIRTWGAPPLRSRWMLLIDAARRVAPRRDQVVVIEHEHPHDHDGPGHGHRHPELVDAAGPEAALASAPSSVRVGHSHTHRHVALVPKDPFGRATTWSALAVGMLHGVGAETPTQVLVFAAAAHAGGRPTSIALLLCFVAGLVASNTLVAGASTLGFRHVLTSRVVSIGLAAVTATFSLVVGTLHLTGHSAVLPPILGGG